MFIPPQLFDPNIHSNSFDNHLQVKYAFQCEIVDGLDCD